MSSGVSFGVCVFDNPNLPTSGWTARDGSDAERISGVNELSQDTNWVTNLNYRVYSRLNLHKAPFIMDEQYFRSSIKNIGQEVGLSGDGKKLAEFCAVIVNAIHQHSSQIIGRPTPVDRYRYYSGLSEILLSKDMRKAPSHHEGFAILEAVKQSTQANQGMFGVRAPLGSSAVPVAAFRGSYFKWVLSQKIPSCDNWKKHSKSTVGATLGIQHGRKVRGTDAAIAKLCELGETRALLLRITVESTESFYKDFSTFGIGSNYRREYASLPEVLHLSRFCRVTIHDGYSCGYGGSALDYFGLKVNGGSYSYAHGIALENVFCAVSNPYKGEKKGSFNAIGAFLRAYDRIMCARYAEGFAKAGITVGSYGTGKVVVYCKSTDGDIISDVCDELALLRPLCLFEGDHD